jgi:uncharacterized protein (DUF2062 family)
MKVSISRFFKNYKQHYQKLKQLCFDTDPKKTALALTIGICVGIIPVLGVTLITITLLGFIFRLNQVVIQTTHILISPLQVVFFPIFLKAGQWLFMPSHVSMDNGSSASMMSMNILQMITKFGHLIVYGFTVWLVFSAIFGFLLYRFWVILLSARMKTKQI